MPALIGPYLALALALVVSGLDKLRQPEPAAAALRSARLLPAGTGLFRRGRRLARLLGATEFGIGLAALVAPLVWPHSVLPSVVVATAMAAMFVGFAWFVTRLANRDATASCGCFGSGAPPGVAHRRFNLAAALLALVTALAVIITDWVPNPRLILDTGPGTTVATVALLAIAVPIFLVAPSLLAATDPRHQPRRATDVPTFAINQPMGETG